MKKLDFWFGMAALTAGLLLLWTVFSDGQTLNEVPTDSFTLPSRIVLAWDNQTVEGWEVQIAQNTCHHRGNGLIRTKVEKPFFVLGNIKDIDKIEKWKYPIYTRVRGFSDNKTGNWTEKLFELVKGD